MTEQNNQFTDFDNREKPKTLRDEFALGCLFFIKQIDEEKRTPT